jgi:hypothetical protein
MIGSRRANCDRYVWPRGTPSSHAKALAEGESLLDTLTPVEQEGARYGYRQAGPLTLWFNLIL